MAEWIFPLPILLCIQRPAAETAAFISTSVRPAERVTQLIQPSSILNKQSFNYWEELTFKKKSSGEGGRGGGLKRDADLLGLFVNSFIGGINATKTILLKLEST